MASDKEEAEELHRDALHGVVHDIMAWLMKQRTADNVRANQLRHKKGDGVADEIAKHVLRAKAWHEAIEKLKALRKEHGEAAARASVIWYQNADDAAVNDPTPEQIAAKCKEIQEGWSERERQLRHWQQPKPVEAEPTNFVF